MGDRLDSVYREFRNEEQEALAQRVNRAYTLCPALMELDRARAGLLRDVGAGALTAAEGTRRLGELGETERRLLASVGMPEDALQMRYRCPDCRDTGWVGSAPKRPCACRLKLREKLSGERGINSRETFSAFSESVYRDETQKKRAMNAKKLCENYAAALPRPPLPNLLLMGMPGLGKSYLANAVCYEAISRGVDACRVTAYRFVQDVLCDIRSRSDNAQRYMDVPLLALDDLGSEPDIGNVSTEWLFAVINERALAALPTVYVTNLSLVQLQERYGERVMSRLCDRNTTTALRLTGENLRTG